MFEGVDICRIERNYDLDRSRYENHLPSRFQNDVLGWSDITMSDIHDVSSAESLRTVLPYIFEYMDVGVIIANEQREIVTANPAALALFGYTPAELESRKTEILYAEKDEFVKQGKLRFNTGAKASHESYITRYRRKDESVFQGETLGGPIRDIDSGSVFFIGIIKDVTTQLSAEKALNRLHGITSSRRMDFGQRVQAILELGCEHFGLPVGIFSRITGDTYTIEAFSAQTDGLQVGMTFDVAETYCSHVLSADGVMGFHHVKESDIASHPCYQKFQLEAYLGSVILVDGERYGTLNFSSPIPTRPFIRQDFELIRLFAEWLGHEIARKRDIDALESSKAALEKLAATDPLTQLYNRRYAQERLAEEIFRSRRHGHVLTVALFDFDHFKRINDDFGHQAGDDVLRLFANDSAAVCRRQDIYSRWGGEEFLAIFPETTQAEALTLLDRLITSIKRQGYSSAQGTIKVTMSVGVASLRPTDTRDELINRADKAMYQAKQDGRDCIRSA